MHSRTTAKFRALYDSLSKPMQEKSRASYRLWSTDPISTELKAKLHDLRRYRNKWVHVEEPWDDQPLLEHPEHFEVELEQKAQFAARVLRETIYSDQWL